MRVELFQKDGRKEGFFPSDASKQAARVHPIRLVASKLCYHREASVSCTLDRKHIFYIVHKVSLLIMIIFYFTV